LRNNIHISALEMASPGNQHSANCIGTLSFHACVHWLIDLFTALSTSLYADKVALPAFAHCTPLLQQSIDISCRRAQSSKPEHTDTHG